MREGEGGGGDGGEGEGREIREEGNSLSLPFTLSNLFANEDNSV